MKKKWKKKEIITKVLTKNDIDLHQKIIKPLLITNKLKRKWRTNGRPQVSEFFTNRYFSVFIHCVRRSRACNFLPPLSPFPMLRLRWARQGSVWPSQRCWLFQYRLPWPNPRSAVPPSHLWQRLTTISPHFIISQMEIPIDVYLRTVNDRISPRQCSTLADSIQSLCRYRYAAREPS